MITTIEITLPADTAISAKLYFIKELGFSSGLWKRVKHSGTFRLNGVPVNAARTMLKSGDIIEYALNTESSIVPEPIDLDIVYEDEDLLVVNKPAGMLVHPTTQEQSGTIGNAVLHYYASQSLALDYHPCHRLDRQTSGLLLIAKRPEIHHLIAKDNRLIRKYLAIVEGILHPKAGTVDLPIARALPSIIQRKVDINGKPAITHYRVLGVDDTSAGSYHTLVELILGTGRTHQIRVHMSHIDHPLAGDDLYGGSRKNIGRQALHSAYL